MIELIRNLCQTNPTTWADRERRREAQEALALALEQQGNRRAAGLIRGGFRPYLRDGLWLVETPSGRPSWSMTCVDREVFERIRSASVDVAYSHGILFESEESAILAVIAATSYPA